MATSQANAQSYIGAPPLMVWSGYQVNQQMQRIRESTSNQRSSQPSSPKAKISSVGIARFNPVATMLMPKQLATAFGETPQQCRQLEQLFTIFLQGYQKDEPEVSQLKDRSANDVARALTYYIVANYYVYSEGKQPSQEQYRSLYEKIHQLLLQGELLQTMSDQEKQKTLETLAIMAMVPQYYYEQGKQSNNTDEKEKYRMLAAQNLARLGFTAEKMEVTNQGLVIK